MYKKTSTWRTLSRTFIWTLYVYVFFLNFVRILYLVVVGVLL